jgi:hypothetical protein
VNRFGHPTVKSNLFLTFVLIKDATIEVVTFTSGHVSRSVGLESGFECKPFAPAVSRAAADI